MTSRRERALFRALLGLALTACVNAGCTCAGVGRTCATHDDCRALSCSAGKIPACMGTCACDNDLERGDIGRFSSLAMRGSVAYLAAYNNTYGDLMIGHVFPPGIVDNWEFVDGVPEDQSPSNPLSRVRGGIEEQGDDVGRYTSIAITPAGNPIITYYDKSHGVLKFASFGAVRWHAHIVDSGTTKGDEVGRYASLSLSAAGVPGIAYYAEVKTATSRESQLRYAFAKKTDPQAPGDWTVVVVDRRTLPEPAAGATPPVLPEGIALFCASARKTDGSPVIVYYDGGRGNLRFVEYVGAEGKFGTPIVLDGEDAMGHDTADVGQFPSVAIDRDIAHIAYVDASRDNLLYVNSADRAPEVVDDGYRATDELTKDKLPAPVYHLVGDSSSIQVVQGQPAIAYQDSTVLQLRFAQRDPTTRKWGLRTIAGHATPFAGAYGFYAQNRLSGGTAVLSSYAINQQRETPLFYVETFAIPIGGVM